MSTQPLHVCKAGRSYVSLRDCDDHGACCSCSASLQPVHKPKPYHQQQYQGPSLYDAALNQLVESGYEKYRTGKCGIDEPLLRLAPPQYGDGVSTPAGETRANPRAISNEIFAQSAPVPNKRRLSAYAWSYLQMIDHDLDLTTNGHEFDPVSVPQGDAFFDPEGTGEVIIRFYRSKFDPNTGTATDNPRQQINEITCLLDGSSVYGSTPEREAFLRAFRGGRLKTSTGDLLPVNDGTQENASAGPGLSIFVAGDVRANENLALTSLHTVFVREHNRIADDIFGRAPNLGDDEIFRLARILIESFLQSITYNEILPLVLGSNALPAYAGFDSTANPQIANVFSTAAYRFGHSLVSSRLDRFEEDGSVSPFGNLSLREGFFSSHRIANEGGIDPVLRGLARNRSETVDRFVIADLRSFLFGAPGAGGLDLVALNLQRGRDHGLADYNTYREALGLGKLNSFDELTSDAQLRQKLTALYGNIDNVDVFCGGLVEPPKEGSMLGPLFHAIVADQFRRIRDGDRWFYLNRLTPEQIQLVESTTLSDIVRRNSGIESLPQNVFLTTN